MITDGFNDYDIILYTSRKYVMSCNLQCKIIICSVRVTLKNLGNLGAF